MLQTKRFRKYVIFDANTIRYRSIWQNTHTHTLVYNMLQSSRMQKLASTKMSERDQGSAWDQQSQHGGVCFANLRKQMFTSSEPSVALDALKKYSIFKGSEEGTG